jgi:AraC family transcriptional regulator
MSTSAPWSDILRIEKRRVRAGEHVQLCPQDYQIALRLGPSGSVEVRVADERPRRMVAHKGDLCLLSQGVQVWEQHRQEAEFLCLALAPSFVTAVANQEAFCGPQIEFTTLSGVRDPSIQHILLALQAEVESGYPAGRLFGEGLATALAAHLLRHYTVSRPKIAEYRGGMPPAKLRRVLDYIVAHLDVDTSLKTLAEVAQLSSHHFATVFKASIGLSPHQYILRQRITKAKELLADNRMSIAEITYALGFPSQAHFTTMFGKLVGTTPGRYRDRS